MTGGKLFSVREKDLPPSGEPGAMPGAAVETYPSVAELAAKIRCGCDRLLCAAGLYWKGSKGESLNGIADKWMPLNEGGMDTAVYLDLVVALNFLVDLLLLLGTNRLSGFPLAPGRAALAAALGAAYSGVCLLPGFRFLDNTLWRLVCLGIMGVLAFGCDRSAFKRVGVFVLLSMALGGAAMGLGRGSFLTLVLAAAGVGLLCRVAFGEGVGGRRYVPVEITYGGKTVSLTALEDSGNTLRDPITGEGVLVISGDAASGLTGLTENQLRAPLETLAKRPITGLRLIPYQSVGNPGGMLLAMRFADVKIGSRKKSVIVAFAPDGFSRDKVYQALVTVG